MITSTTFCDLLIRVNRFGTSKVLKMYRHKDPEVVGVIKLARQMGYKYDVIASYYVINQGRIADVMKGRIGPEIPPATELPRDFPPQAV